MLKFSDLLKNDSKEKSFLLGMIYSWVMLDNTKEIILAYSSYKTGSRIEKIMGTDFDINKSYFEYIENLKKYINKDIEIKLNSEITYKFTKTVGKGVSILIEFDQTIGENIDSESYILGLIEKTMLVVEDNFEDSFILGFMTGRSSADFTANFITIDLDKRDKPEIARRKLNFLYRISNLKMNEESLNINFNPRVLQPKSSKKNDQFRIPLDYFVAKYGFLNPLRIATYCKEKNLEKNNILPFKYGEINEENFIQKLEKGLEVNEFAIKLKNKNLNKEEKEKLISEYRKKFGYDSGDDEEIQYADVNIKIQAKEQNEYMCEIDKEKESFKAKSNNKNYVEAHHLIPFSKRSEFNINIDILENIVCLTPKNHRKVHLAVDEERIDMLKKLYDNKSQKLKSAGIDISFEKLKSMYGVNEKTETRKFIPITDVFDKELFEKGVPVLAEVNAGEPLNIAEENLLGYIVDGENKKIKKDDLFAVRVDGDSMNEKEINGKKITNGSYALVKNTPDAENGDIILAIVNGNATIKQYYKKQNTITLRSISTQNTPDITITNPDPPDFLINGQIVGVI